MNKYEKKRQARIDRLKSAADRAEKRANDTFETAHKMSEAIPFGQPIHAGHYSERSDRNYRNRISNKFDKAMEEYTRADELRAKAEAAENNTAVSSDDPDAIIKLEVKLKNLTEGQAFMKAINKFYKQNGTCVGFEGISEETARKLDAEAQKDYNFEKRPFQSFELTNNNANIRNVKQRIEELKLRDSIEFESYEFSGGRVVANKEINRVQIFFDDIPDEKIRKEMKSMGFKFSRYNDNAWQRQLSGTSINAAMKVVQKFEEQEQAQEEGPVLGM